MVWLNWFNGLRERVENSNFKKSLSQKKKKKKKKKKIKNVIFSFKIQKGVQVIFRFRHLIVSKQIPRVHDVGEESTCSYFKTNKIKKRKKQT